MKLNHPIKISLKDFFIEGKFDCIDLSKSLTKEWILNNFPDPDSKNPIGNEFDIWLYKTIEFHFDKEDLFLIWCDYLDGIQDNKKIIFDKWILEDSTKLSLRYVLSILNSEQVNYMVKFDTKLKNAVIKIKKSQVCLWFDNFDDESKKPNDYQMIGFGLNHPEYDSFSRNF